MKCCEKCFLSNEIIGIIQSLQKVGDCDFCESINVHTYDLSEDCGIDDLFNEILSIFRIESELIPLGYLRYKLFDIKYEFKEKWNIFNTLDSTKIYELLYELLSKNYSDKLPLLSNQVGIIEWIDDKYLNENSVLKGKSWEEFVKYIKYENRFHSNHVNYNVLKEYIFNISYEIENDIFYRARISNSEELTVDKLGAPPKHLATAGRANSEGISHLYLASNDITAVSEIRPSKSDTVFVGRFPLNEKIKVVDFRLLSKLDVFSFSDPIRYAINLDTFIKMSKDISKPVRSGDSKLDYLPTQFIVDFIKSLNKFENTEYSGIIYDSTLSSSGYNIMLFEPDKIVCSRVEKRRVDSISYQIV